MRFDYFPYQISDSDLNLDAVSLLEKWKPQIELWQVLVQMNELQMDSECLYRPFGTLSFGERTRVKSYETRIEREIEEKEGLLQDIETVTDLKIQPLRFHKEVLISAYDLGLRYEGSEKEGSHSG
ncbi:hypothetical protein SAMN02745229_01464 [Butyrivibrio fibrisolvens DSM 3071]|uniref:Uncharacterized protein n=1 Tax=Butyrivibrio fibrisolvens DSM 3071 TaxID=1121131 RepID=A0A1M5YGP5_BUTFI|nr:hypothetical protein [Butyrivibrio fibrisolvens]SHI11079.1 hypothetical protein SAMN02745229_01464 [Butyrivibrio fibrisolvens DSM 3071]